MSRALHETLLHFQDVAMSTITSSRLSTVEVQGVGGHANLWPEPESSCTLTRNPIAMARSAIIIARLILEGGHPEPASQILNRRVEGLRFTWTHKAYHFRAPDPKFLRQVSPSQVG